MTTRRLMILVVIAAFLCVVCRHASSYAAVSPCCTYRGWRVLFGPISIGVTVERSWGRYRIAGGIGYDAYDHVAPIPDWWTWHSPTPIPAPPPLPAPQ